MATLMKYEVVKGTGISLNDWKVEAIDFEGDGDCFVTIFCGPDSEKRAREYAEWKGASHDQAHS